MTVRRWAATEPVDREAGMAAIDVGVGLVPLVDEGLGNSAYLVDLGDGRALVVDPSRDLRAVRAAAQARRLRVAFAADTHLHADFLSGARQLAADEGARVLASAAGGRAFGHVGLADGDEVDLGGLRLRALATPGHTVEHLAFLLLDGDAPVGVFTGGSLLVGAAARTDLVAPERTEALARAQYASIQRLLTLGDETAVWPTHGAGSFCSAPPGAERTTTIGREKATNPLLRAGGEDEDENAFVAALLDSLGSFPPYFLRLAEVNRRGPAVIDTPPTLAGLDVAGVRALLAAGAELVDVRPVADFAAGHVAGSLSIPLRPAFASWLGWLAPHDRPLAVVRNGDQDPAEILWQALKIGYENVAGELACGIPAWTAAGQPTATIPLVWPDQVGGAHVLDIRQRAEFAAAHLPGATHVELGDLPAHLADVAADLPAGPVVVMCGHGERAMGAASLLARTGQRDLAVLDGGPGDWATATGRSLHTGA
jgi:glyoxylase-like metal-dependent hydrolase (beta-lactamase superfamily II)/rhodanese-related sulfurtransferase